MGGLFGGDTSTTQQRTITTTTKTDIGDIGLTGQNAVDLAAVIQAGGIARDQIHADALKVLTQESGKGWQHLMGGAGDLVQPVTRDVSDLAQGFDLREFLTYFLFAGFALFLTVKVIK